MISKHWSSSRRKEHVAQTVSPQAGSALPLITADARASGEADVLREVEKLLGEGRPAAALERIGRSRDGSPWLANAAAVCRLPWARPGPRWRRTEGWCSPAGC